MNTILLLRSVIPNPYPFKQIYRKYHYSKKFKCSYFIVKSIFFLLKVARRIKRLGLTDLDSHYNKYINIQKVKLNKT